jgi:hypothetical protein
MSLQCCDAFSERYATHEEARASAERAAAEQRLSGVTEVIEYRDEAGDWREEVSQGMDQPGTDVARQAISHPSKPGILSNGLARRIAVHMASSCLI